MQRAFSKALSIGIVAGLVTIGIKVTIERLKTVRDVETTRPLDEFHIALPNGAKFFRPELVPQP